MTATAYSKTDFADYSDADIREADKAQVPVAQFPMHYTMQPGGLIWEKPSDKEIPDLRKIAGPFEVLAMTRDNHGEAWGVLISWRDDDGKAHSLAVARSMLAGDGREVRAAMLSGGLYVSPATTDRNALNAFLMQVKIDRRARAVSRVGWCDGAFALPDRTIGEGTGDLVVYQGTASVEHDFRTGGTLEGWKRDVAALAAGNSRMVIALSAGFVGPLLSLVGQEGGGLHLRGASSIGKSTALEAAASIWGPPRSFVRQWRATSNGLEGIAELANDNLLCLDELAQLDPKDAGTVAYLLANGTGKSRAGQSGEARAARRWLTFFLSTGEVSLAEHARSDGRGRRSAAGQDIRILDVEADAGAGLGLFETLKGHRDGDQLARAIKANAATNYGHAGPAFVGALIGQEAQAADNIKRGMSALVEAMTPDNASGQVKRAAQRFALMAIAGELATDLGVLPWEGGEATRAARLVFGQWIEARGGAGNAEERAHLEHIAAFLTAHGASRFQVFDGDGHTVVPNRVGFIRKSATGTEYLIPSQAWRAEVCTGFNAGAVAATLAARGHLLPDSGGKMSQAVTIPRLGKARCYVIQDTIFAGGDNA